MTTHTGKQQEMQMPSIPIWKHFLDLFFVILTASVWLPIFMLVALWIRVVSRGPILLSEQRIGYGNKLFICLSFRTLKIAQTGKSCLIPLGFLLRSIGLDDLPQLINVLRREMSLVGPRPCTLSEYEQYSDSQKERFNTLPGITGLWQVSGKNRTTFEEMNNLDIAYARKKTPWMDLDILFKTLPAICMQLHAADATNSDCNARKTSTGI